MSLFLKLLELGVVLVFYPVQCYIIGCTQNKNI